MQMTPHDCSLFNYNSNQAVIFNWHADGSETLAVQDAQFQFQDSEFAAVVEIDDQPLVGNLVGHGSGNIVTIALDQPVDDRLRSATTVMVHLANVEIDQVFRFDLATQKMPALLTAVGKCRAVIK